MRGLEPLIKNRRLVFSLVGILMVVGIISFGSMARQEDPSFPYRAGGIKVIYPGGTPSQIEKLITSPLEEELAQIEEINKYNSNSRDDIAIIGIALKDSVYDTDAAWNRVERAIERASREFPDGVQEIDFDDRQIDLPVSVISITGSSDLLELSSAATRLKHQLISLPSISRIEVEGEPQEELVIKIDQGMLEQLGLSRARIAAAIEAQNRIIPGGVIQSDGRTIRINTQSDYASVAEVSRTSIFLDNGQYVPLSSIANVAIAPRSPLASLRFDNGAPAVSLGIIVTRGQTDVVKFGQLLRDELSRLAPDFAPLEIRESFFQPDYVSERLTNLQGSLLLSMTIIAAVVFFALGWRTGILVATVLPVVSMITLGLYNAGGGVFHQIAVIGIVISLGILIDNAIVVIEFIETRLREGAERGVAIRDAMRAMAKPLFASTGTTVAAFIPLLLAKGGVGDFTRAIPTMIVIALIVSYLISVFVWPLLAFYWMRERPVTTSEYTPLAVRWTQAIAARAAAAVVTTPFKVLGVALLSVLLSLALAPSLKQQFFPSSDRNQFVLDIELPVGTSIEVTERISRELEDHLQERPEVTRVYRAVGATGFRFYYNLTGQPDEAHVARITVNTKSGTMNQRAVNWVREDLERMYPQATLIARILGQGPPRPAPIEVRITHPDPATLFGAAQKVRRLLHSIEGVADLRTDLDLGAAELALNIRDYRAASAGLSVNSVAAEVFAQTRGVSAGEFRYTDDPIPIRVRSFQGDAIPHEQVANQNIYGASSLTPLGQLASLETRWAPTNIRHYAGARTATVLAELGEGGAFNQILDRLEAELKADPVQPGVIVEFGGDAEASQESNSNIATAAPLAIALLIFFIMYQFNSFRRIGIIFATIPLAAVGVIPGLALTGEPFGFQSLLGVIALVGIVVNNAIVLIDVVDRKLVEGAPIADAVTSALEQRTSPIILTTATTILGLLPLAFSSSTLWPPMAWAIISGLLLSTLLTLVAIPALCVLCLGRHQTVTPPIERVGATLTSHVGVGLAIILVIIVTLWPAKDLHAANPGIATQKQSEPAAKAVPEEPAATIDLQQVIGRAQQNLRVQESQQLVEAAKLKAQGVKRQAWAPKVQIGGQLSRRDAASSIDLPTGTLNVADRDSHAYEIKVTQPLFQPALQRYQTRAAKFDAQRTSHLTERQTQLEIHSAIRLFTDVLSVQQQLKSNQAMVNALVERERTIDKRIDSGSALKSDLLQVQYELNRANLEGQTLAQNLVTAKARLGQALGLPWADYSLAYDSKQVLGLQWPEHTTTLSECGMRTDCEALRLSIETLKQQHKALSASGLPNVALSYADTRSDGQLFVPEQDQRIMLEVSWSLFSGGVRASEKRSLNARKTASQKQLENLMLSIDIDVSAALRAQSTALAAIDLAAANLELNDERLRLVRARYDNGLANLDTLLEAEAARIASEAQVQQSSYQYLNAWADYRLSTGLGFF